MESTPSVPSLMRTGAARTARTREPTLRRSSSVTTSSGSVRMSAVQHARPSRAARPTRPPPGATPAEAEGAGYPPLEDEGNGRPRLVPDAADNRLEARVPGGVVRPDDAPLFEEPPARPIRRQRQPDRAHGLEQALRHVIGGGGPEFRPSGLAEVRGHGVRPRHPGQLATDSPESLRE